MKNKGEKSKGILNNKLLETLYKVIVSTPSPNIHFTFSRLIIKLQLTD